PFSVQNRLQRKVDQRRPSRTGPLDLETHGAPLNCLRTGALQMSPLLLRRPLPPGCLPELPAPNRVHGGPGEFEYSMIGFQTSAVQIEQALILESAVEHCPEASLVRSQGLVGSLSLGDVGRDPEHHKRPTPNVALGHAAPLDDVVPIAVLCLDPV